jgi:hypothetical protein
MTYRYSFDHTIVGDLRLTRANYLIVQEGLGLLSEELDVWNERALEHGAASQPYQQEAADLTHLMEWGSRELSQTNMPEIVVKGISVGNLRYVKAALMLVIRKREADCAQKAQDGWPGAALGSLNEGIERVRKIADTIDYEPSDVLWEVAPKEIAVPVKEDVRAMEWDVFISHASEDKDGFVRPLAEGLRSCGLKVWFDEFTLTLGDSLRRSIDRGLAHSRFGIVVISADFLRKEWPQKELDGLVAREVDGVKVILPVWHGIDADQIRAYSPTLADRLAVSSKKGVAHVIAELVRAIRPHGQSQKTTAEIVETKAPPIVDLWVNTDYPQKLGLNDKLKADGYDLKWETAINEATSIDLEGWEHVTIDRTDGTRARLKIRDAQIVGGYVVLLKRRKASKGG